MNSVQLVGNLTKDPESYVVGNNINKCVFTLAVKSRKRREDGNGYEADFFRVTVWRQLADTCQKFLTKGSGIAVTGHLDINSYTDKEGKKHNSVEVIADSIDFLQLKPRAGETAPAEAPAGFTDVSGDELPF